MKSYMASASTVERKWYVVDAADYTLGRLASQVASVLRGKNKPTYTPFIDCGDNVIVINADKVRSEDLLSSFRLCWWYERNNIKGNDGKEA